jgi:hypothetical protein
MGAAMQGTVYAFPTRSLPQLLQEEDPDVRMDPITGSWFGEFLLLIIGASSSF